MPAEAFPTIGKTPGHYQIVEKTGAGGRGVVHRAGDTRLYRFVLIKLLSGEQIADPDRKRCFVQEAKAASASNHTNIVTIREIDAFDGTDFIVMERSASRPTIEEIRVISNEDNAGHTMFLYTMTLKPAQK